MPRITLLFLFIILYSIVHGLHCNHGEQLEQLSNELNSELTQKHAQIENLRNDYSRTTDELQSTQLLLESTTERQTRCQAAKIDLEGSLQTLDEEKGKLLQDLEDAQERLSSLAILEQITRRSLIEAREGNEELLQERNSISESFSTCQGSLSTLGIQKDSVEKRIVELKSSIQFLHSVVIHEEHSLRQATEVNLQHEKENVRQLEYQLDRAWYLLVQIGHLEQIIEDRDNSIIDLEEKNQQLNKEQEELKLSMELQEKEAVRALSAVTQAAAMRHAGQIAKLERSVSSQRELMVNEAALALQSIASISRERSCSEDAKSEDKAAWMIPSME